MEPYSQTIARFLCGLKLEEVPQGVVDKAKLVFLDTLGIALASSTMDFGRMVMNVAQKLGGAPASRLIGSPLKVAAANAVLANGTLAHGLDYDDTLEEAIVHTGCCAGMTALAVGEELRASGKAVLEAAIAGTEVMCKVGLVAPGKFHARGLSSDSSLFDLWRRGCGRQTLWSRTCSMERCLRIMRQSKLGHHRISGRRHLDQTIAPGLVGAWRSDRNACLHSRDFADRQRSSKVTHGFYRSFGGANEYPFEKFSELGRTWEIPKLTFKSYPCGSISHPYMDCALTLRQKYAIAPEQVAEIVCRTAEGPVHRLWEPLEQKRTPPTSYAAKFSLPFSIAVMLIRGRAGLEEFSDEAIRDPEILSLAKKVRYELDPTIDYPRHFSGHVKIKLADGTVLEENQPHPRGGLESPLPPEEIEAKFRANARLALSEGQLDLIVKSVKTLEQLPSITTLTRSLIGHDPVQNKILRR